MAFVIDGVTLPDIPAAVLEKYPYAIIGEYNLATQLVLAKGKILYIPNSVGGSGLDILTCASKGFATYSLDQTSETPSWVLYVEQQEENLSCSAPAKTLWANHNIETVSAVGDDGTYTVGETHFPSSVAVAESDENLLVLSHVEIMAKAIAAEITKRIRTQGGGGGIPAYTEADYGKMLTPTADGLVWTDPPQGGEVLEDLEGVLF